MKYKQNKCDEGKDEPLVCYSMVKLVSLHSMNFTVNVCLSVCQWDWMEQVMGGKIHVGRLLLAVSCCPVVDV